MEYFFNNLQFDRGLCSQRQSVCPLLNLLGMTFEETDPVSIVIEKGLFKVKMRSHKQ